MHHKRVTDEQIVGVLRELSQKGRAESNGQALWLSSPSEFLGTFNFVFWHGVNKFGDDGYAREELVANLGSAFLCADLTLAPEAAAGCCAPAKVRHRRRITWQAAWR